MIVSSDRLKNINLPKKLRKRIMLASGNMETSRKMMQRSLALDWAVKKSWKNKNEIMKDKKKKTKKMLPLLRAVGYARAEFFEFFCYGKNDLVWSAGVIVLNSLLQMLPPTTFLHPLTRAPSLSLFSFIFRMLHVKQRTRREWCLW